MLADRTARVSDNGLAHALAYFERDGDGLEGEAVCVVGARPRRRHVVLFEVLGAALRGLLWGTA